MDTVVWSILGGITEVCMGTRATKRERSLLSEGGQGKGTKAS